jgi:hypothetical protein
MHACMIISVSEHSSPAPAAEDSVQEHWRIALQQAIEIARLLKPALEQDLSVLRLWPICGYGAFMAGIVLEVCRPDFERHGLDAAQAET